MRAHAARVTALAFSPFDATLLLSAGADDLVKVWRLPDSALDADVTSPATCFRHDDHGVAALLAHPSADGVVAACARDALLVYDLAAEQLAFRYAASPSATFTSACWNYDGSMAVAASSDRAVRFVDPRALDEEQLSIPEAHASHRHIGVAWGGALDLLVTTGSDAMQARELKLWDPRQLARGPLHRERVDAGSGGGPLYPLYDPDIHLLFVLGRGDRAARCFEVDATRSPFVHALDHSAPLTHNTVAAALVPKAACNSRNCEVARVLSLSGSACEVLSYSVPRKEARHSFQRDLFPDTRAPKAAMEAAAWRGGENARPLLEPVEPKGPVEGEDTAASVAGVFGRPAAASPWGQPQQSQWTPPAAISIPATAPSTASGGGSAWAAGSGWNAPIAAPTASTDSAPTASNGWRSGGTKWNAAPTTAPTPPAPAPVTWTTPSSSASPSPSHSMPPPSPQLGPATSPIGASGSGSGNASNAMLSEKAQRLGAKYGHKLKYIRGQETNRTRAFYFGDKSVAPSPAGKPVVAANASYWAVPTVGAGGPVLVQPLSASGKASHASTPVLSGHKAEVTDLAFSPFRDELLASGSADSIVQIWSVSDNGDDGVSGSVLQTLTGHERGIRTVQFHPTAANVLCSSGFDMTLRLWDVETAQERTCVAGKLDDAAWNVAFNDDGDLLATSSRAKVVRVFDPRQSEHALVAMGCGFDSAKPQFVQWASASQLVTVGVNGRNETQLSFWDARSLLEPLAAPVTVESSASSATLFPYYDASSRLLFLVGLGSRQIWSYELEPETATAHANLPFMLAGQTAMCGAALLPKTLCDIRNVELDRLLVVTPSAVEQVAFSVPRAEKLKEFFQDDVYAPVRRRAPLLSADEWFDGAAIPAPEFESLCPEGSLCWSAACRDSSNRVGVDDAGMVALSERPKETVVARPKTLDFQAQLRREEELARAKAEQFERLSVSPLWLTRSAERHETHGDWICHADSGRAAVASSAAPSRSCEHQPANCCGNQRRG